MIHWKNNALFLLSLLWLVGCVERPPTEGLISLDEEFVLGQGETAVIANTDLVILNEGEGSEYYTDDEGNEVHEFNIKLIINGKVVFLDNNAPETAVGNYMIKWQIGNRLHVTEKSE